MTYEIVLTAKAERQMLEQALWWADHHSLDQAIRWHDGLVAAIETLAVQPLR